MELWLRWHRLKHPFTLKQKLAIFGRIPMTKELFWDCMTKCHIRYDSETRQKIWKEHHQYIEEFNQDYEHRLRNDADFRAEQEAESQRLKALCLAEFGEEWINEHWQN